MGVGRLRCKSKVTVRADDGVSQFGTRVRMYDQLCHREGHWKLSSEHRVQRQGVLWQEQSRDNAVWQGNHQRIRRSTRQPAWRVCKLLHDRKEVRRRSGPPNGPGLLGRAWQDTVEVRGAQASLSLQGEGVGRTPTDCTLTDPSSGQ